MESYEGFVFIKNTFANIFDFVNESTVSEYSEYSEQKSVVDSTEFPQLHKGLHLQS